MCDLTLNFIELIPAVNYSKIIFFKKKYKNTKKNGQRVNGPRSHFGRNRLITIIIDTRVLWDTKRRTLEPSRGRIHFYSGEKS